MTVASTPYVCECGWTVWGNSASKTSRKRGNCGFVQCFAIVREGTVVRDARTKSPSPTKQPDVVPKPSAKTRFDDQPEVLAYAADTEDEEGETLQEGTDGDGTAAKDDMATIHAGLKTKSGIVY